MAKVKQIQTGTIVDETTYFSLKEICEICGTHAEYVLELITYGILEPQGKTQENWRFSVQQVQRSQRALRLQRDLDINLSGIALTLELLEEMQQLQQKVAQLEQQLKLFDPDLH